jgi:hypothetical protein
LLNFNLHFFILLTAELKKEKTKKQAVYFFAPPVGGSGVFFGEGISISLS